MERIEKRRIVLALLFTVVVVAVQQRALYQTARGAYRTQLDAALVGFASDLARDLESGEKKPITRRLDALEQTGLFGHFALQDRDRRIQAGFPDEIAHHYAVGPVPIINSNRQLVGYYSFDRSFTAYYRPFLLFGIGNSLLTLLVFAFSCLKVWPLRGETLRQ